MGDTESGPRRPGWIPPCVALAVGLLLLGVGIGVLFGQYDEYVLDTPTMAPTVEQYDRILVRSIADGEPRRGDIVTFDKSAWQGEPSGVVMVRRVVGVGGDRVSCCDDQGRIQVNGHAVTEEYQRTDRGDAGGLGFEPFETTVPDGMVFVLGDWRSNSVDSRLFIYQPNAGAVPVSQLDGRVVGTFTMFGGAKPIQPTPAFTDAGLAGSSTSDNLPVYAWWACLVGFLVFILAFVWMVVVGSLRAVRPRPQPLPWT